MAMVKFLDKILGLKGETRNPFSRGSEKSFVDAFIPNENETNKTIIWNTTSKNGQVLKHQASVVLWKDWPTVGNRDLVFSYCVSVDTPRAQLEDYSPTKLLKQYEIKTDLKGKLQSFVFNGKKYNLDSWEVKTLAKARLDEIKSHLKDGIEKAEQTR